MNWKQIFVLVLIILIVMVAVFFFKYNSPLTMIEKDIINYIEETSNLNFEIGKINCWPLNRLILKDLKLKKGNSLLISIPEVNMYYNITKVLTEPKKWYQSLTYVSISKPTIIIRDSSIFYNNDLLSRYQAYFQGMQVDVNKGYLSYVENKNHINLFNINACLKKDMLEVKTEAYIKETKLDGYNINNLTVDNVIFNLNISRNTWQGTVKTDLRNLSTLTEVFSHYKHYEKINIKGNGQAVVNFRGIKSKLKEYSARVVVDKTELYLDEIAYINGDMINNINGEIKFSSDDKKIRFDKIDFSYSGNDYIFDGQIKIDSHQTPEIEGQLTANNLELSHLGLALDEIKQLDLAGKARLNMLLKGKLTSPRMYMDIYIPRGMIGEEIVTHLNSHIRYNNSFFYVDSLNLQLNGGDSLTLSGVYNTDSNIYSFNCNGENINVKMAEKYFADKMPLHDIDGKLSFVMMVNGKGLNFANVNANGKMEILSPQMGYNKYQKITGKIWLADRILLFDEASLKLNKGDIDFSGSLNLANKSMNINLDGEGIDPEFITTFIEADIPLSGKRLDFKGNLLNTINSPQLDIKLSLAEGIVNGIELNNLTARTIYTKNKLTIKKLNFDSYDSHIKGSAEVNFAADTAEMMANLNAVNIDCSKIYNITGKKLPLKGNINRVDLFVRGPLNNPVIKGAINSEKIHLSFAEKELPVSDTSMSFSWQQGQPLLIENLSARQDGALLSLNGKVSEKNLDLYYNIDNFNVTTIKLDKDISGQINVNGSIRGDIASPVVKGNVATESITVRGQRLKDCKGEFAYKNQILQIDKLNCNRYKASGMINNLLSDKPYIDLNLEVKEGKLDQILNFVDYKLPLQGNYIVRGNVKSKGYISELETGLDLAAWEVNNIENFIKLKGEIGKNLDLMINGENVRIKDKLKVEPDLELCLQADVNITGNITGTIPDININMQTTANNAKVNDTIIENINGRARLTAGENLELEQKVSINGNKLNIGGDISLSTNPKINLDLASNNLPLSIITGIFTPEVKLEGNLDGKLNISGYTDDLTMDGEVNLSAEDIRLGLPDKINYVSGKIQFQKKEIRLSNCKCNYAGNDVDIRGKVFPFTRENFWDIDLTAVNLPFNSGSLQGSIDPDLSVNGSFKSPIISGEVLTHDLNIKIPFTFQENYKQGMFKPVLDIVLKPGKDVNICNQYLDIVVEKGSLGLSNEGEKILLKGKVSSRNGSFDYYNNKFIMEKGYATFKRFDNNIPEIWASAYTYVRGVKIFINIDGPADNMLMTFHSQPELSRKEIINLLVSKGGLGEFTSEEGANLPDFLKKELTRFFQETFQLEFIENIEEKVKEVFELDRMEIDTYELGFDEDISIYLGKQFSEKLYLEYSRTFSLDDTINYQKPENELSFYYYLNDKTHLEGSWLGDENFTITIETELKF